MADEEENEELESELEIDDDEMTVMKMRIDVYKMLKDIEHMFYSDTDATQAFILLKNLHVNVQQKFDEIDAEIAEIKRDIQLLKNKVNGTGTGNL